jgi:alpha-tubulin suppressor-like RCC1 family protein
MKKGKLSGLLICAGLLTMALLSGCGSSSSNTAVPATATIFGTHSVVFGANSSVKASGYNGFGQLGTGVTDSLSIFTTVNTTSDSKTFGPMSKIATGGDHTMAFSFANVSSVYVWGSNNHGQIGDIGIPTTGTTAASLRPLKIPLHGKVQDIAAGLFHSLAVVDGQVWAWGYNGFAQIGDNTFADHLTPKLVNGSATEVAAISLPPIKNVAAGTNHSLALTTDGRVFAWGDNTNGQLGVDPTLPLSLHFGIPQVVRPDILTNVVQIAAGGSTSYALQEDPISHVRTLYGWGYDGAGQFGGIISTDNSVTPPILSVTPPTLSSNNFQPQLIPLPADMAGSTITKISAGLDHLLVLFVDGSGQGSVWTIGFNNLGQLGDTTQTSSSTLKKVTISNNGIGNVIDISASGNQSLARLADNTSKVVWYGWGDNAFGQLGNSVPSNSPAFHTVPILALGF